MWVGRGANALIVICFEGALLLRSLQDVCYSKHLLTIGHYLLNLLLADAEKGEDPEIVWFWVL